MDPDISGSWVTLTKGKPIPDHENISFWGFTCAILYQEYSFLLKWGFFVSIFVFVCLLFTRKNLEKNESLIGYVARYKKATLSDPTHMKTQKM